MGAGLSYPDITVVPALAHELGVTSDELMSASENVAVRAERTEARKYRAWRGTLLWSTGILYATAVLTCFIVNISVSHRLDWFWVVLAAVALAGSLTTLPMLLTQKTHRRGWIVLGAATLSLGALLGVVALLYGYGLWLPIAFAAVVFAIGIVFTPIVLRSSALSSPLASHVTVLSLAIDTVLLGLFLLIVFASLGQMDEFFDPALALAGIGAVPVWVIALVIRYLPGGGLVKAGVAVALVGVFVPATRRGVDAVLGSSASPFGADFSRWTDATIQGNIEVLIIIGCGLVSAALLIAGWISGTRRSAHRALAG